MTRCTWENCEGLGVVPQIDNSGEAWAVLCQKHHNEMRAAITGEPFGVKRLVGAWVKAQGGAKKAANRMMGAP